MRDFALDGLTYYYRGLGDNINERVGAGLIVGNSLLTARGIPTAGEADLKTNVAMFLLDRLGAGGSYTEFYALDFDEEFVLMGHDGPGHVAIADGRPVLRALKLFHGKSGAGLSVEMKVRLGPVTILGLSQTADGRLKLLAAEGESIAGPDLPHRQHQLAHPLRARPGRVHGRLVRRGPDAPRRARRRAPRRRHPPHRGAARPRAGGGRVSRSGRVRRDRPGRRERARRRAAGWPAGAWSSRRPTASPTARCACPTACAGTCSRSTRRALDGLRAAAAEHALRASASTPGASTTRCSTRAAACSGSRSITATSAPSGMVERAHARVPREEMYRTTGIQTMPINTVFQLLAEEDGESLAAASRIALVPDLLTSWLSGVVANEATAASTTGLLDARSGRWADELIERLGLPSRIFGELVEPGTVVGGLLPHHELGDVPVCAVAGHDTASAFVAAPLRDRNSAVLSSGTWSLLGLELDEPVLDDDAQRLQPLQRARRRRHDAPAAQRDGAVAAAGVPPRARAAPAAREYEDLLRLAEAASDDVPLFDPDDEDLLRPGDMPKRIAAACVRAGSRRRPRPASSCAASSSRWPASTASCSSASSRSRAGASRRST